jgi:hypothetical protein
MKNIQPSQEKIDRIISMLLGKWFVIVGKDDVTEELASFIESNRETIYNDYVKEARKTYKPKSPWNYDFFEKDYDIDFYRHNGRYNTATEAEYLENIWKNNEREPIFERMDVLINLNIKTLDQILIMFGLKDHIS